MFTASHCLPDCKITLSHRIIQTNRVKFKKKDEEVELKRSHKPKKE
jgi:hypothetical protein